MVDVEVIVQKSYQCAMTWPIIEPGDAVALEMKQSQIHLPKRDAAGGIRED